MAATEVTMPQLGESVTEGQVSRWLKHPGDAVERYEPLVEVITDKVNAEVPSPVAGVMGEIHVHEGDTVAVGTLICTIKTQAAAGAEAGPAAVDAPAAPTTPGSETRAEEQRMGAGEDVTAGGDSSGRASPAVRRLAQEHHVDIAGIKGSGGGGRVTKKDVEDFVAAGGVPAQAPLPATALSPGDELVPLSPMRKAIAEHMVRSKQTAPHAWCAIEVDMTGVVELRASVRESFREREGVDLTFPAFGIHAACQSLRVFPGVNATYTPEGIVRRRAINVSVAVALEDGLILPVVHDADKLSITELARRLDDVVGRARDGKLTLADVERGTFCVNNPGTFGTVISVPIINQPQAAIMTMEAIVKRPVVLPGDTIGIRSVMFMGMSFDHRVMDGVMAASFLQDVKANLEAMGPGTSLS